MRYDDLLGLTISGELDVKNKVKKRIYIASFLNLFLNRIKEEFEKYQIASYKTHITHFTGLLTQFENTPGGLTFAEIENISKFEKEITSISKEDINNYSSQNSAKLEKYGSPVFGNDKLKKKNLNIIVFFAHTTNSNLIEETKKIEFKEINIRRDLYPRGVESPVVRKRIDELVEVEKSQFEKEPLIINQKNELVDGYIRLMAIKRQFNNSDDFYVNVTVIKSDDDRHLKH